jgi:glycosyltransferase involved in cell wall biosynthesis
MRVVFISSLSGLGGGESNSVSLISELKRGYQVEPTLIVGGRGSFLKAAEAVGIKTAVVNGLRLRKGMVPYWNPAAYRALRLCLDRAKPAVVHVNDWESLFYVALIRRLHRGSYSVVWTCHGWWQPKIWPLTWAYRQTDRILVVSKFVREKFFPGLSIPAEKIEIVHLGVDTEKFCPRPVNPRFRKKLGLADQEVGIGIIGRFQKIKGHARLLTALKELVVGYPCKIFFIGENVFKRRLDERNIRMLKRIIKADSRLSRSVIWTGFRQDIEEIISALDLIVCPSDFESFGLVNLEAMASSRAVLSTNVGGPAEVIVDGKSGFLFSPNNRNELVKKLEKLIENKKLREDVGKRARISVENTFSIKTQAAKINGVYQRLVK